MPKHHRLNRLCGTLTVVLLMLGTTVLAQAEVNVGRPGPQCQDDPHCFNRLHSDIPMVVRAEPGERITIRGRVNMGFDATSLRRALPDDVLRIFKDGTVLKRLPILMGPVHIEGAHPGDVLAVTIERIKPGPLGYSYVAPWGPIRKLTAGELLEGDEELLSVWHLNDDFAVSEDFPGVKIPNKSFMSIISTLPGKEQVKAIVEREKALLDAGGLVWGPEPEYALPAELCGPQGSKREECVRTIPPREFHGGDLAVRYLGEGATIYLPCNVEGCGLSLGCFHYAQGDSELMTTIETTADVSVTARIIQDGPDLSYGPHYEGSVSLLDIPSKKRFYAVTGFPVKPKDVVPSHLEYLDSPKVAALENLAMDTNLAARNAMANMIAYIERTYGFNRLQAFTITGLAVDLRIGHMINAPNVTVSAILPLDIFERQPKDAGTDD